MNVEDYFTVQELDILNSLLIPLVEKAMTSRFTHDKDSYDLAILILNEKIKSLKDYQIIRGKI